MAPWAWIICICDWLVRKHICYLDTLWWKSMKTSIVSEKHFMFWENLFIKLIASDIKASLFFPCIRLDNFLSDSQLQNDVQHEEEIKKLWNISVIQSQQATSSLTLGGDRYLSWSLVSIISESLSCLLCDWLAIGAKKKIKNKSFTFFGSISYQQLLLSKQDDLMWFACSCLSCL